MEKEKFLLDSNFEEYINRFVELDIPSTCIIQDYRQSELIRRQTIKYYVNRIKKYPLRDIGKKEDKILNVKKTKEIPMSEAYLGPLISCSCDSSYELSIVAEEYSCAFQYLMQQIVVSEMAKDFKDSKIEKAFLWYLINHQMRGAKSLQNFITGKSTEFNPKTTERLSEFALASALHSKYKKERTYVLSSVRKMVINKSGIAQLLNEHGIDMSSPEIMETLKEQQKTLILS